MTTTWNITRRPACRRRSEMFVMLSLAIVSVARTVEAAPSEITVRSSSRQEETLMSGASSRKSQSEEVGNPSDLAWQAWLLVDGNANPQASGILDSASLLRRITPKSIFIAPALTACAEGYQADTMNRCVKDVSIDSQAHRGFLVERLNALFAHAAKPQFPHASSSSASSSLPTGPLQLNIPLLMSAAPKPIRESPKLEHPEAQRSPLEEATSSEAISPHAGFKRENTSEDAIVTLYELDDSKHENIGAFSSGNKSAVDRESSKISSTSGELAVVQVLQDPEEDLPLVVDYKIPVDEDPPRGSNLPVNTNSHEKNEDDSSSAVSPTLVLLLAPTRLTSMPSTDSNDAAVPDNSSLGRIVVEVEKTSENATGEKISVSETLVHLSSTPTTTTTNEPENVETTTNDTSHPTHPEEDSYDQRVTDEDESTEIYDEDDETYDESTELDDEILKHSEAGLTVTPASINEKSSSATTTSALFPSVANSSDNAAKESGSQITSEVTVNSDFVRETTLVDFHPNETKNVSLRATTMSSPSERRESTTILPVGSSELDFSETAAASLTDAKNEKRADHASNVEEVLAALDREIIVADWKFGNEEDRKEDAEAEESPRKNTQVDNAAFVSRLNESDSATRPINDEAVDSNSNETSINATRTKSPEEEKAAIIYPVGGIEEVFEASLPGEVSSTERSDSAETMMAASTNVAGAIVSREESAFIRSNEKGTGGGRLAVKFVEEAATTRVPSAAKPGQPARPEEMYDYEIPSRDSATFNRHDSHGIRQDDISPIIRTIDEERYRPDVNYELSSSGQNADNFFPLSSRRDENYVRFPNYEVRGDEPTNSRVRFPSDEANSIPNEYKERNRRPYANRRNQEQIYSSRESNGANRLPDASRKESYRWSSNDRLLTPRSSLTDQRSRDRAPMLLKFWTRMPLVRDPSMPYSARPGSGEQRHRRVEPPNDAKNALPSRNGQARRANRYGETTSSRQVVDTFRSIPAMVG